VQPLGRLPGTTIEVHAVTAQQTGVVIGALAFVQGDKLLGAVGGIGQTPGAMLLGLFGGIGRGIAGLVAEASPDLQELERQHLAGKRRGPGAGD